MSTPHRLLGAPSLALCALVLAAAAPAPEVRAATCAGSYSIDLTRVGLHLGAGANYCGQGAGGSTQSDQSLVDGQLPDDLFDADKAYWASTIAGWALLDPAARDALTADVTAAYDDLGAAVDGYLTCLPDRLVVKANGAPNWFGWQSVAVTLIDDDCGSQQTFWTWTTIQGCGIPLFGVLGGQGELQSSGLAVALGTASAQFQTQAGHGSFSVDALFTALLQDPQAPQCGLLLGLNLGLGGAFTLTRLGPW
ncbi:MAG: hypothetical protein H6744_19820 [Deltaproteobacteria bacterium]|nr:hypothetical protein [Deltaproteobacteria bacterium]